MNMLMDENNTKASLTTNKVEGYFQKRKKSNKFIFFPMCLAARILLFHVILKSRKNV